MRHRNEYRCIPLPFIDLTSERRGVDVWQNCTLKWYLADLLKYSHISLPISFIMCLRMLSITYTAESKHPIFIYAFIKNFLLKHWFGGPLSYWAPQLQLCKGCSYDFSKVIVNLINASYICLQIYICSKRSHMHNIYVIFMFYISYIDLIRMSYICVIVISHMTINYILWNVI